MTPCPEYESQILDSGELAEPVRATLQAHLKTCPDCWQFSTALAEVDGALAAAFPASVELPAAATAEVLRRAEAPPVKPSLWPELFDMVGWASLIAALFVVSAVFAPRGFQEIAVWAAFGLVMLAGSSWFVVEGWREFEGLN